MSRFVTMLFIILFITQSAYAHCHHAVGRRYMTVSAQKLATRVGDNILKKGGNAIDAAVAMGYALAVVHPCCGNIGGGGFMLIHMADGKNVFVDFREKAPQHIKASMLRDNKRETIKEAYLTVGVPGTVMGLNTVLKQYGTMPLSEVIAPAIKLARKGFLLTRQDVQFLDYEVDELKKEPRAAAVFLNKGHAFTPGERLVQKDLASTLTYLAQKGTQGFYQGSISEKLIAASQKNGGILTKKDFSDYSVELVSPVVCHYRGYTVITAPPPSSGGITICQMLNIAEGFPVHQYKRLSLKAMQLNLEIMRRVYRDKKRYIGDPKYTHIPVSHLLSKKYAAMMRKQVKENLKRVPKEGVEETEGMHTSSYTVVDKYGDIVVVTVTLNDFFGARVVAGDTGVLLNSELTDFSLHFDKKLNTVNPNAVGPGRRPVSAISPTIVLKDGKLFVALSTPGGPTIPTQTVLVLQNIIDHKMTLRQSVDALRYHMQGKTGLVYVERNTLSRGEIERLERLGYTVHMGSPYGFPYWGGVAAVMLDPKTRYLHGAMDGRRPGGLALGR